MNKKISLSFARKWAYQLNERTNHVANDHVLIEKIRRELLAAYPHRTETIIMDAAAIGTEFLFSDGSRCAMYFDLPGKIVFQPSNDRAATASPNLQ